MLILLSFLALAMCGDATVQLGQAATPDVAVQRATKLLEDHRYSDFLVEFVAPAVLKKMTSDKTIAEVADDFGRRRSEAVLQMLRAAKEVKPAISENGTRADYRFNDRVAGQSVLILRMVGSHWYIE